MSLVSVIWELIKIVFSLSVLISLVGILVIIIQSILEEIKKG